MAKLSIKTGEKFGRLTIISYTDREGKKGEYKCVCDYGKITYARTSALKTGRWKSCGCLMRENLSKRTTLPDNMGNVNAVYKNYKQAAKRRNYNFSLTKEESKEIIESDCYYCGEEPSMIPNHYKKKLTIDTYKYNGVDRIDNNIGYIKDNVVSCCKICNNAKSTLSLEDFKQWLKKVYKNLLA
jgi:hypothetical protein